MKSEGGLCDFVVRDVPPVMTWRGRPPSSTVSSGGCGGRWPATPGMKKGIAGDTGRAVGIGAIAMVGRGTRAGMGVPAVISPSGSAREPDGRTCRQCQSPSRLEDVVRAPEFPHALREVRVEVAVEDGVAHRLVPVARAAVRDLGRERVARPERLTSRGRSSCRCRACCSHWCACRWWMWCSFGPAWTTRILTWSLR